jgi:predicted outer membrane repeat protein
MKLAMLNLRTGKWSVNPGPRLLDVHRLAGLAGLYLLIISPAWAATSLAEIEIRVNNTRDAGAGSLRQAIQQANTHDGPALIRFDAEEGPFATPQEITLKRALPALMGELIIDGYIENRLWQSTGVTLSGANAYPVFTVAAGARVTLRSLTIARGQAQQGGGIANHGELIVEGVTFTNNSAARDGGALVNLGGTVTIINSTFAANRAADSGGGLANLQGAATVTNCTFSGNSASVGGALFSTDTLLLRNTLLANSEGGADCVVTGVLDPASTHNLIETHQGCGQPISRADPRLRKLGYYNGSTRTLPLGSGSPAINLGDNASAVDEGGKPLRWDQRGNGDPRFIAGITDIGAFERQALPVLMVDTLEDAELRACTQAGADCSLRGAMRLANATAEGELITFDPQVFADPQTLTLTRAVPEVSADLTLDARGTGGVTLRGKFSVLRASPGARLTLHEVVFVP